MRGFGVGNNLCRVPGDVLEDGFAFYEPRDSEGNDGY